MDSLISVEEAQDHVLSAASPLPIESVATVNALGRVLATAIASPIDLPPFDTSAMDGYAVHLSDLAEGPLTLPVAETVHAGDAIPDPLPAHHVIGVMTGAPLPPWTDAIVPVEWTHRAGDTVHILRAPVSGQFIRPRGSALANQETVFPAGDIVTPATIGLASAMGMPTLPVMRRPRVAVLSTGDELVVPGQPLSPGQIWDANGPGLAAQVSAAGGDLHGLYHARDTPEAVAATLDAVTEADVVAIAGGVSMGERDLVRPELEARGVVWAFWGVRQRPGKPFAFGLLDGTPVFGLPGNPVSAAVGFEVYVRPLIDRLLGRVTPDPLPARLSEALPKPKGLHTFARVTVERDAQGALWLSSAGPQGSHVARTLAQSDGLAHLPEDWDEAPEGAEVEFTPWAW